MSADYDVVIVGGGFGGSLLGMALSRRGQRVALLERGRHPRVVIGESSTPMADFLLARFAERYGLDELRPLCTYGTWCAQRPELDRGLKRGFSYFAHDPERAFVPTFDHANELLVAASVDDDHGDTHWWRADVDHALFDYAGRCGATCCQGVVLREVRRGPPWRLVGEGDDGPLDMIADVVIDASGPACALAPNVGVRHVTAQLHTHSRAVYGHFRDVTRWGDIVGAGSGTVHDHPFRCDAAAVHHLLDGAWMWQLHFDSGIVSAGVAVDTRVHEGACVDAEETWRTWIERYPSLARMFERATPVRPLQVTPRVQRLCSPIAGQDWALLPNTACFIDPLHSTGIAHTLTGVTRLADLLEGPPGVQRSALLTAYAQAVDREARLIDVYVDSCYRALPSFELYTTVSMMYFVAATYSEYLVRNGGRRPEDVFLMAHDGPFVEMVEGFHHRLIALVDNGIDAEAVGRFQDDLFVALRPYSVAGLCNPARNNMYAFCALTAPPAS